ncbi:MAG: hypothetical protein KF708_19460 [Pirellulales bacterium]|nr:hypothetical protein [Pirellulales bacterium]
MKDIDFLPSTYRELHRQRRATMVRLVLVLSVAGTIVAAALTQHAERRRVMARLADVQLLHKEATARQAMLTELQGKLERANAMAGLLTFLRHPWPKSQLMTEVLGPLPEAITLERVEVVPVTRPTHQPAGPGPAPIPTDGDPQAPQQLAAVDDLEVLRTQAASSVLEIRLWGLTSDHSALHMYLMALGESKLLLNPELERVEGVPGEDKTAVRFMAHVTVRPSPGMNSSPSENAAAPAVATTN